MDTYQTLMIAFTLIGLLITVRNRLAAHIIIR